MSERRMTGWEYCRLDEEWESPDGPNLVISYYEWGRYAERIPAQDPGVELEFDGEPSAQDEQAAVLMFTTYRVIDRMGAEGWEAFQVETHRAANGEIWGKSWYFKRPRGG